MASSYQDLADLLLNNERAQAFYKSLPDEVQLTISKDGKNINTMSQLRNFAASCAK